MTACGDASAFFRYITVVGIVTVRASEIFGV
jgi:hypothetical protein